MSLDYEPELSVILSEEGDDRSVTPHGEMYADHAVLMCGDCRVAEWRLVMGDWPTFVVQGSDIMLTAADEEALSGWNNLTNLLEFAKRWYLARLGL